MNYWITFYFAQGMLAFFKSKHSLFFMVTLSILFAGLRYEIGNDYFNYLDILNNIDTHQGKVEWGFFYLASFINLFPYSEFFLFFSFSFFTLTLIGLSFKELQSPKLAFFLYLISPGLFLNSFHVIRQMLAVSLFLYAVVGFHRNKSYLSFFLYGFISVAFHYTAIIPFVLFAAVHRLSLKPKLFSCVAIAALTVFSFFASLTNLPLYILVMFSDSKFEIYSELGNVESYYKVLAVNLVLIFYLHGYNKYKLIKDENYLKLFIFGVLVLNIFSNFSVVTRVTYYFIPFGIILLCNISDEMKPAGRTMVRLLYIVMYLASTYLAFLKLELLILSGADFPSLLNYNSIFSK